MDEQYSSQRGKAYLNVIDVHSGQVWATLPPIAVGGESWTLVWWYLGEQGLLCERSVSDGGRARNDALGQVQRLEHHQRDVWHVSAVRVGGERGHAGVIQASPARAHRRVRVTVQQKHDSLPHAAIVDGGARRIDPLQ